MTRQQLTAQGYKVGQIEYCKCKRPFYRPSNSLQEKCSDCINNNISQRKQ